MRLPIVAIVLLAAGGCTHSLGVAPMGKTDGASGAAYVLPFTQYTTTITWRLVDCETPKVSLSVQAVPGAAPDADHAYMIDPASLQTLTSIGAFKATWPDGSLMLSSVNVLAEDRSAAIAGHVVTATTRILPLVLGAPPPGAAPAACTPGAADALRAIGLLKPELERLTTELEAATAELSRLTSRLAALGAAADDGSRRQVVEAADRVTGLQARHQTVSRQLASALERITASRVVRWPEDGRTVATATPYEIDPRAVARWFTGGAPQIDSVHLSLERVGSFGRAPLDLRAGGSRQVAGETGLRYRVPATGRLVACNAAPCASDKRAVVLAEVEGPVAQLGYVHLLPIDSRTFGSTTFAAEFTPMGGLRSVGYEQKTAPAEAAASAAPGAVGDLADVLDPTARLQRETAYLEALQARRAAAEALEPATDDPIGDERAAIEAETALLEAQIAQLEARAALERLQGGT